MQSNLVKPDGKKTPLLHPVRPNSGTERWFLTWGILQTLEKDPVQWYCQVSSRPKQGRL
jgi:hypothetical protein